MLSQLRQMSKLEPNINCGQADVEPLVGFQLPVPEQNLQFGQKDESLDHNSELVLGSSYEVMLLLYLVIHGLIYLIKARFRHVWLFQIGTSA